MILDQRSKQINSTMFYIVKINIGNTMQIPTPSLSIKVTLLYIIKKQCKKVCQSAIGLFVFKQRLSFKFEVHISMQINIINVYSRRLGAHKFDNKFILKSN